MNSAISISSRRAPPWLSLSTFLALAVYILLTALAAGTARAAQPESGNKVSEPEARGLLRDLLPSAGAASRLKAVATMDWRGDVRFIGPLIDLLRFVRGRDEYMAVLSALDHLTHRSFDSSSDPLSDLMIWDGAHSELSPPPGYTAWKGELYAQMIDPRFRNFLYEGAPARIRVEEVVWGGVRVDGIPALINPEFIRAQDATYLEEEEPVFGVSIHGDNRAYPLRIMDWHEMANDVVGGVPVALAYCTLCGSGILYDARANGRAFVFGSSGLLFRSNKLMYDHETNTLWNQLTGEPVIGRLAGSGIRLNVLPVVLTSWVQWRSEHPDTKALSLHTGYPRDYTLGATYGSYFASPTTMFPVWRRSGLLPAKASVFAVVIGGLPKAYAVAALEKSGGVVNDTIGSTNLVVIHDGTVGSILLPRDWAGDAARRAHHPVLYANDLTAKLAEEILKKRPELSSEVSAKFLLAMPVEERLQLLTNRTDAGGKGQPPRAGYFPIALRNEVALQGLIGETRAYDRGAHKFQSAASPHDLRDERGHLWKETEDALVGPNDERLIRLGGHLSFWFGWYAFYPQTAVFAVPQSMR